MDFAFNSEQELLRTTLAAFAARELAPHYMTRDQDIDLPRDLVRQLGAMGLLAPMVPVEYGGAGADYRATRTPLQGSSRAAINARYGVRVSALVGAIAVQR